VKIIFLGTSGSMPTQSRGSSAIVIRRKGEVIFFDCGEGTQRRMVQAHIGFRRHTKIFISHLHGDHVLGLPGLIQTMTLLQRDRPLHIYGPEGIASFIQAFSSVLGGPGFPMKIYEISSEGLVFQGHEYGVRAVEADHDGPSWSYVLSEHPRPGRFHPEKARALGVPEGPLWGRLQHGEDVELGGGRVVRSRDVVDAPREGFKIVYSGDTRPTEALVEAASGADVLIHEATFDDSLAHKADENRHSTVTQAAMVAREAGVETLILTHISSRYPDASVLLEEAVETFPNTIIAEDLLELELPLDESHQRPEQP
jgi:ribonuclease Z